MHAVLQEALVDALHVLVDRAHFRGAYELGRESQPGILVTLARVLHILDWVLRGLLLVVRVDIHMLVNGLLVIAHHLEYEKQQKKIKKNLFFNYTSLSLQCASSATAAAAHA